MSGILDGDRARKRRLLRALSISSIVVVLGWWISGFVYRDHGSPIATIARLEGALSASDRLIGQWNDIGLHQTVHAGQQLRSGPNSRVALSMGTGISLRLDRGTHATLRDGHEITLSQGALYVDSHAGDGPAISTPHLTVGGTHAQYEVRLFPDATRVRARMGQVEIRTRAGESVQANAGEQLTVTAEGAVGRQSIDRDSEDWAWAASIAPPFRIEGRTVAQFLSWVEREGGTAITFDSPQSEAEARTLVLRGSIDGLSPAEALEKVLPSTPLQATRTPAGILIGFADALSFAPEPNG